MRLPRYFFTAKRRRRSSDPMPLVALITTFSLTIGQNVLLSVLLPSAMVTYGPFIMAGLLIWNGGLALLFLASSHWLC
ncbi:hypothetical protein [Leptolyngbya sp. FACHB-261]|uniref:hypothetical protein n=1 Tax=Leptolyngbya sp. FACHB-261 TaxID=2692806 RepID=UPI001685E832|nr:hypothetical protein [Leptolyngbya sp. FACHB-261]MBD2102876.1 hypothetical protein [Leptolyngbya sp. FACHB-261]